jgi:hypothetical protein
MSFDRTHHTHAAHHHAHHHAHRGRVLAIVIREVETTIE